MAVVVAQIGFSFVFGFWFPVVRGQAVTVVFPSALSLFVDFFALSCWFCFCSRMRRRFVKLVVSSNVSRLVPLHPVTILPRCLLACENMHSIILFGAC
jgi:hypothetical protein